jgi:hypothetical protein
MGVEQSVDDVDREVATAFGLFVLSDATLHEATAETEVTRLELEMAIEQAGFEEVVGLETDADVSETIDELLDGH